MVDQVHQVGPRPVTPTRPVGGPRAAGPSFTEVLQQELKISRHAGERLSQRQINLGPVERQKLAEAISLAASKGARESLVLLDDVAMVVNVPQRTVVTAVETAGLPGRVFTNIDSAVIMRG